MITYCRIRNYISIVVLLTALSINQAYGNNHYAIDNNTNSSLAASESRQIVTLSDQTEISLMTCGPGEALYSLFGHSALWVYDRVNNIDLIFNYGTFDFSDPNFYYLFLRGKANYMLSISNSTSFINEYKSENRFVKQQRLNLTADEKQSLFETLIDNYRPENRYYRYDFLFLNCSSIIRDRVFETTNDRFKLETESDKQPTFRDLLGPYLNPGWVDLGINLLLSHKADRQVSNWEKMFLPNQMFEQFRLARTIDSQQLAPEDQTSALLLSTREATQQQKHSGTSAIIIIILVLILLLSNKRYANKWWHKGIDFTIFFLSGLIGTLLTFMWFFSEHTVVHQNINLMWAFPLHILFAFIIFFPGLVKLQKIYAKVFLVIGVLFYILVIAGFQVVPNSILLITSIVLIRLFRLSFFLPIVKKVENEQSN